MDSMADVGNFAIIVILFIYIMALTGMQFFANRLHFNPITLNVVHFNEPTYNIALIPRSHFDDFFSVY